MGSPHSNARELIDTHRLVEEEPATATPWQAHGAAIRPSEGPGNAHCDPTTPSWPPNPARVCRPAPPEAAVMVAVPEMAEFVDHGVFQNRLWCEDQMPVQVHDAVRPATAPHVLLVLDAHPLGLSPFGSP
jgi:hypothetical protein